jgi:hypothetical protein
VPPIKLARLTKRRRKSREFAKRNREDGIKSCLSQIRGEVIEIKAVRAQAKDAWQRMIPRSRPAPTA